MEKLSIEELITLFDKANKEDKIKISKVVFEKSSIDIYKNYKDKIRKDRNFAIIFFILLGLLFFFIPDLIKFLP